MFIMTPERLLQNVRLPQSLVCFLLLIIFSAFSFSAAVSAPVSSAEILRIKKERQGVERTLKKLQMELRIYQSKLNTASKQEKQSLKTLENIRRQILVTEKLIKENQSYLVVLDGDIDSLGRELNTNRRMHARLSNDLGRTAVSVYKYGRNREAEHLFASGSVNEALVRSKYMGFFARAVASDVEKLQRNAVQLENNRVTLQKRYQEKAAVVKEQELQLKDYAKSEKQKEVALERLKQDKQSYAAQLNIVKAKRQQLQSKIQNLVMAEQKAINAEVARRQQLLEARRLEQQRLEQQRLEQQRLERQRLEQERRERERADEEKPSVSRKKQAEVKVKPEKYASRKEVTIVPDYSSRDLENVSADFDKAYGSLPWPVRGGVVSQKFGSSMDHDLKIVTTNNGIDITVPAGTPVRAVSGGKVVQIAYLPTFGNIVIVRHPNSYLTVYANLGALSVTKNEIIKSQQLIGVSGKMSEGGSVVHFEIWKGRVKQNPERWLRR
jgi:septal ring factor EnvC (AmiA/AmiB activator)